MSKSTTSAQNLWQVAVGSLDSVDRAKLDIDLEDHVALLQSLLMLVKDKQERCMEKRWRYKKPSGQVIILRDLFEKTSNWIQKFKEVGDVAVQYDPSHASLPWAAVRFVLQTSINDVQIFGAVAQGIESIARLIARCAVYEAAYLSSAGSKITAAHAMLKEELVALYSAILSYLARADTYYKRGTAERILKSTAYSTAGTEEQLNKVLSCEREVEKIAQIVHGQMTSSAESAIHNLQASHQENTKAMIRLIESLEQPITRVMGSVTQFEAMVQAEERKQLAKWLSSIDHRSDHQHAYRGFLEGTGTWLFKRPEYAHWQTSSSSSMLWLRGIPGCGKTKLSAHVVASMQHEFKQEMNAAPVAYFHCSTLIMHGTARSAKVVLNSILKQLAFLKADKQVHRAILAEFKQRKYEADQDGIEIAALELEESIQLILAITTDCPVTIVIDGVDKLDGDPNDLLDAMKKISDESPNIVKVLLASRDDSNLALQLKGTSSILISSADNSHDLSAFVEETVSVAVRERRILQGKVSTELHHHIVSTLTNGASSMFLWASLHIQQLCDQRKFKLEKDVRDALQSLPSTLRSTLDQIYHSIDQYSEESKAIAREILGWLLVAERPLSKPEIMLAIAHRNSRRSRTTLDEDDIFNLCSNFISWDSSSSILTFAHASVSEYLRELPEFSMPQLNSMAANRCLEYLIEGSEGYDKTDESSTDTSSFHVYAVLYWLRHYSRSSDDSLGKESEQLLSDFIFGDEGQNFLFWLEDVQKLLGDKEISDTSLVTEFSAVSSDNNSPLFASAIYGLVYVFEELRTSDPQIDWNAKNTLGATPLYVAARYGQLQAVEKLIQLGAGLDAKGGYLGNPVQAAAFQGHDAIVQCLLDAGADPLQTGKSPSALHAALAGGHQSTTLLLLGKELFQNLQNIDTMMTMAAYNGQQAVVELLLKSSKDESGCTAAKEDAKEYPHDALQASLYRGRIRVATNLLKTLTNVNLPGGHFGNALQAAAFGGNFTMVPKLLELGADVNGNGRYGTPLKAAAFGGHDHVIELLLSKKARLSKGKGNALEAAASAGWLSTVTTLIKKLSVEQDSAQDDFEDDDGLIGPALHAACRGGHTEIARLLLEHGALPYASAALETAFEHHQEQVAQILLKNLPEILDYTRYGVIFCSVGNPLQLLPEKSWSSSEGPLKHFWPKNTLSEREVVNIGDDERGKPQKECSSDKESGSKDPRQEKPGEEVIVQDGLSKSASSGDFLGARTKPIPERKSQRSRRRALPGPDFEADQPQGKTFLGRLVASQGSKSDFEALLSRGFDLKNYGSASLEVATIAGNWEVAELLLDRGADIRQALQCAIRYEQEEIVHLIFSKRPDTNPDFVPVDSSALPADYTIGEKYSDENIFSDDDLALQNPLAFAVGWRRERFVTLLLNYKELSPFRGPSPALLLAILTENEYMLDLLLNATCNPAQTSWDTVGKSIILRAIRLTVRENQPRMLTMITQRTRILDNDRMSFFQVAVHEAAVCGRIDILKQVRESATSEEEKEVIAGTMLLARARNNCSIWKDNQNFEGFIAPYVNSPSFNAQVPKALREAARLGNYKFATTILRDHSSSYHLERGSDVLHLAIHGTVSGSSWWYDESPPFLDFIQLLIKNGVSVDSPDTTGKTPLYLACCNGLAEVFRLLVDAGADIQGLHREDLEDKSKHKQVAEPSIESSSKPATLNLLQVGLLKFPHRIWSEKHHMSWATLIFALLEMALFCDPNDPGLTRFLESACEQGNGEEVEKLLNWTITVGETTIPLISRNSISASSALHIAAKHSSKAAVQSLLQNGADVQAKRPASSSSDILTPLQCLLKAYGYDEKVVKIKSEIGELLVDNGASEEDCESLLQFAVENDNLGLVDQLLRRGTRVPKITRFSSLDAMKLLLRDVNPKETTLEGMEEYQKYAVRAQSIDTMEYLREKGIPLAPMDLLLNTAFYLYGGERAPMLEYLVGRLENDLNATFPCSHCHKLNDLLLVAHVQKDINFMRYLLDKGADPDCPGLTRSALQLVCCSANRHYGILGDKDKKALQAAQMLIEHGADVDGTRKAPSLNESQEEAREELRQTPLMFAVADEHGDLIKFLIENGADINRGFISPLNLALRSGNQEIIKLLISKGAVVKEHDVSREKELDGRLRAGAEAWRYYGDCYHCKLDEAE